MGLADDLASLRRPNGVTCSLCSYIATLDDAGRAAGHPRRPAKERR